MKYRYFQVYDNYFWQWEDNNKVLAIPNGNTIAYCESVAEVIEELSVQGLPAFGSLLLAIIATSQHADGSLKMIRKIIESIPEENRRQALLSSEMIEHAFHFLRKLSELPAEYKERKKLILLFQTIFQNYHNKKSIKDSGVFVGEIKMQRIHPQSYIKVPFDPAVLNIDFRPLALLNGRFESTEALIEKIVAIPQDVDIELNPEKEGDLISDLIAEPKTFHIGSLIRQLWGGLNIPMHYSDTSQQKLGGVSDISNKGDFDKLFISEFANEDEVFLSRLANNEALYINREAPLQNDNFNQYILIDISLRNWGTPKTIACALMLALVNHPKSKMNYKVYLIGNRSYEVNFNSTKDIINIVDHVDPCLYPSEGFLDFFRNYTTSNSEIVLISNVATMKYPEMKSLLNEYRKHIDYVIHADNGGEIEVFRILKNSSKHIQSLALNLTESWKKVPKESLATIVDIDSSDTHPFRLLFVKRFDLPLMLLGDQGYFIDRGLLFRRVSKNKGWQIIFNKIGKGLSAYQVGYNEMHEPLLLLCYDNHKKINLINLVTKAESTVSLRKGMFFQPCTIYFHQGVFYAIEGSHRKMKSKENKYLRRITLDLQIENIEDAALCKEIEENAANNIQKYYMEGAMNFHSSIIMNVRQIAITKNNCLVINGKHVLKEVSSMLRLVHYSSEDDEIKETAIRYNDKEFKFKNGVTVFQSFYGLISIVLKDGEKIEIPLAVDSSLAMSVGNEASGNPYFYTDSPSPDMGDLIDREMLDLLTNDNTWN
ncbi:hypothetical protein [Dysgonomonas sp. Marseille-P4361]|uniref:hypothetical protein n=1 Tax=Dysgonomonas sp. Marseille-P4361 TaxID=2161820 RepID=UPI00135B626B|nr:hypothetical protein [Dysgonomonas sp. Marseille-P4361]